MKTIHLGNLVLREGLEKILRQLPFSNIAKRPHVIVDAVYDSGRMAMMQVTKDHISYPMFYKEIMKSLTT